MNAELLAAFRSGARRALSRAITLAEREAPEFRQLHDDLWPATGTALRVGVTGPPGAGKSTLVNELVRVSRAGGEAVAVLAVDPTSPFTGGALLGDRVRMQDHVLDAGVFIRSMATRGALGGLARRSLEVADVLDAFGFARIIVETVGVGQIEHDVADSTDLVVVVLHPGAGDSVQAMKAGMLEFADVFVLNKADRPGVERLAGELEEMMQLRRHRHGERIPICRTVATRGEGIDALARAIDVRARELEVSSERRRRRRARYAAQVRRIVAERLEQELVARPPEPQGDDGRVPPYAAAQALLGRVTRR